MIWVALVCALGLPAGFMLLWRVPLCSGRDEPRDDSVSIIVPARNEERNLPGLLESIRNSRRYLQEVLVVDDASSDGTALCAEGMGAGVITSLPLPHDWTGKTWACFQGAEAATAEWLLFLDADTWFDRNGLEKLVALCGKGHSRFTVISLLPYHVMRKPYEEFSVVFNLLMAFGAGGFGVGGGGRLFGQSLLIARDFYHECGGHGAVRNSILENVAFSSNIKAARGACVCLAAAACSISACFLTASRNFVKGGPRPLQMARRLRTREC